MEPRIFFASSDSSTTRFAAPPVAPSPRLEPDVAAEHVLLADAPAHTGAGQRRQVDVLLGELAHQRRHVGGVVARDARGDVLAGSGLGLLRRRSGLLLRSLRRRLLLLGLRLRLGLRLSRGLGLLSLLGLLRLVGLGLSLLLRRGRVVRRGGLGLAGGVG